MEGDYRAQRRTTWFLWKDDVIHTVGFPQLVERTPTGSTVLNWVRGLTSGMDSAQADTISGVATPLKNGSVNPSGSSAEGREVQYFGLAVA
jgi:hypothetical protein